MQNGQSLPLNREETFRSNIISLLKFLLAFVVIGFHTYPPTVLPKGIFRFAYESISGVAVPFFFMSSGYLLSKKMNYPFDEASLPIIKKHLKKLVNMYVSWMIIYMPLAIYGDVIKRTGIGRGILLYIRGFFFVGEQYNSWHLWYLLSSIYGLLVITFLIKKKFSPSGMLGVALMFSVISWVANWLTGLNTDLPIAVELLKQLVVYSVANGRIFLGVVFLIFGMLLAKNKMNPIVSALLMIAGLIAKYYVPDYSLKGVFAVVAAVPFFDLIARIKLPDNKIYEYLRSMSATVYFIHMYIWTAVYLVLYHEKVFKPVCFFVTAAIAFIISLLFVYFKSRIVLKKPKRNLSNMFIVDNAKMCENGE